nr:putative serine/threonine-protein kinase [Ipomoea batatas]
MAFSCFRAFESCKDNTEEHPQEFECPGQIRTGHSRSATQHFHPSNKIGGGGFGVVYKVNDFCKETHGRHGGDGSSNTANRLFGNLMA